MRYRRPRVRGAVLLALGVLVSGCGDADRGASATAPPEMQPTASASAGFGATKAPVDYRPVDGDGFKISAPSAFQVSTSKGSGNQTVLVLKRSSSSPALPSSVGVIRDVEPAKGVVEQTYVTKVTKESVEGVKDLTRSVVEWPGAREAVVMEWTQEVASNGGQVTVRYLQLSLEISDALNLAVVALAPEQDFDDSGVRTVVATMRPDRAR